MRKFLLGLLVFFVWASPAFADELTPARQTRLLNDFVRASRALQQGDPKAIPYLQQVLGQVPDSKYVRRLLLVALLKENRPEEASAYADFITLGENEAEDWYIYGVYLWQRGDLPGAVEAYENALAQSPDANPDWGYQYLNLAALARKDGLEQIIERMKQENPSAVSAFYTDIALSHLRQQQWGAALGWYNRAVLLDENNIPARVGRAEVYERRNEFFLMLHELEELEQMGFGNASTYARMGSVFLLGKDLEKAEQYFLKANQHTPGDPPSVYFLALLEEQKGNYKQAADYLRASADYSSSASKWLQVAFYEQKQALSQQSLHTLKTAYRKFEENVEVGFFYGVALAQNGQNRAAARVFEKLVARQPGYTQAWLEYAYVLESLKQYKKMEDALSRVLDKEPQNASALNLYAYSLALRGERLEQAQRYIARALAVQPQNAFIDTLAWVYFKQGKLEEAADVLNSLPEAFVRQTPETAYHKGAVLQALGRTEQAREYLQLAAEGHIKEAKKLLEK